MTLDDVIEHAEQMAELAKWGPLEDECKQYVEWFKELKTLRDENAEMCVNERLAILEHNTFKTANDRLRAENEKLRDALAKALRVQSQYCDNMDMKYCRNECPLYRGETEECDACDVVSTAYDLGMYPTGSVVSK